MNFLLKEINNKEIWENFLLDCEEKTFLQSWNWGEFQKAMGERIWRFGIYQPTTDNQQLTTNNGQLVGVALVIKIRAKRGTFLFIPHGPNIKSKVKSQKSKVVEVLLEELKKIAKEEKVSFIRIAPILERNEENIEIFKKLGFKDASIHIHPEITWELDITLSEEELLKNMRKTTRYLIKKARKDGVEIFQSKNFQDVEIFNKLYQETAKRQNFVPFSLNFLKNEFLAFLSDDQVSLFFAKYQKEILAGAMIIFWQNIAFYHQGASAQQLPQIPVSYLLQWEAIKEAKKRGCKIYNFWGIAPPNSRPSHRFYGVTLFKKGFGGKMKELVRTQDFLLSWKYWLNFGVEFWRKWRRHLT